MMPMPVHVKESRKIWTTTITALVEHAMMPAGMKWFGSG